MALPPVNVDLTKPLTVFIEKVSEAVGGVAKPWQMKRVATAENDVAKIRALGEIELTEIEQRGMQRVVRQEARRQENIESVTQKAIPLIEEGSKPEDLEIDWLTRFFEHAKDVSNDDMQNVWANILAGKTQNTNSFSLKTLELVSLMDQVDAELFTKFCQNIWMIGEPTSILFTSDSSKGDYNGISFTEISHLDTIGLISFNSLSSYCKRGFSGEVVIAYYGSPLAISYPETGSGELTTGVALLTKAGKELCGIVGSKPSRESYEHALCEWHRSGLTLSTPLDAMPPDAWLKNL